jgi:hypothetical protein
MTCLHEDMCFNEEYKSVWCTDCDEDLDPFEALMIVMTMIENNRYLTIEGGGE